MQRLKAILCPIDFSPPSIEALDHAVRLARKMKVKLGILHVNQVSDRQNIQSKFDDLVNDHLDYPGLDYEFAIGQGKEKDEILRFSKIFKANMIVVGQKGENANVIDLTGSTTKNLVDSGKIAVLSIPS